MIRILIFLFVLLLSFCFGNEFVNKTIVKLETNDDFTLIDLGQRQISNNEKALFDSSKELVKNNLYLRYEDSSQDFVLLTGFSTAFKVDLGEFNASANELSADIFERFVEKVSLERSLELLNKQNNILYQTPSNFTALSKDKKHLMFDISNLLNYEADLERMYAKAPEYILFIVLDNFELEVQKKWLMQKKVAKIGVLYKIVNLRTNKIIKNEYLSFNFDLLKQKEAQANYELSIEEISSFLKNYFSKLATKLK
ncbi:hypothetical protein [Campylobacter sp. MIT 97-5078]|uniref:hypothetical protein n=1 Tax=Campylobacter sp. MIT 97-5078 TaxID=1548153 RepID=UPI0005144BB1|nr:hypothetical protein [Campylobacter sp. MIT 97-5078]KGI56657.1 hypothetical protein LR59_06225 [Campylobacter sp. MIT 97-5078]TQR27129.1 hypothetical protein DMB91_05045 [Campylobacter sp. MIT 97-5078]